MKHFIYLIIVILFSLNSISAQVSMIDEISNNLIDLHEVRKNNEDYRGYSVLNNLLKGKNLVFLGEQSHGEKTVYETKLKLIKYLHEEMGYNILAFEAGFYECHLAWDSIQSGSNVRLMFGRSVPAIWSFTKETKNLTDYIQKTLSTDSPLVLLGFDCQWMANLRYNYIPELRKYLDTVQNAVLESKPWLEFETSIEKFQTTNKMNLNVAIQDTIFIDDLVGRLERIDSKASKFWSQSLLNLKIFISDNKLGTQVSVLKAFQINMGLFFEILIVHFVLAQNEPKSQES